MNGDQGRLAGRALLLLLVFFGVGCVTGVTKAYKSYDPNSITSSRHGIMFEGDGHVDIDVPRPVCPSGEQFMVQGIQVSPEVSGGRTNLDIVHLPPWVATVPLYQKHAHGEANVDLSVFGEGPRHASTELPAGQQVGTTRPVSVRIRLLGGEAATHRFEFNVHLTGKCGVPFTAPGD